MDVCQYIHIHAFVCMIPPICCIRAYMCRCSGDFTQAKQTKYAQALPGLSTRAIGEHLPADLTDAERAVAEQPGMYGRIWYGQGLCFDEAYQILQDRGVYTHTYHHRSIAYCIGVHRICTSPGAHTSSVAYRSNHAAESYIPVAPICLCTHQCCWLYRHKNYPCSTTHGRRSLDRTHPARTRMPAGTTGLSRLANPITKPRPVVASEDTHA